MSEQLWSLDRVLAERPRIRVNQLGYLPGGSKRATLVCDAIDPRPFRVRGPDGAVMFGGESLPWPQRPEPTSGMAVHVLDFSALNTSGDGLWITAPAATSHRFSIRPNLYQALNHDALRFFRLQRSGVAIDDAAAPGYARPAGHVGVAPNRGDTQVPAWTGPHAERQYPGWRCCGLFDVSGGWYDAGDHGKYVVATAVSAAQLLSLVECRRRRSRSAPGAAWREEAVLEECRWGLDWLLRMQVPADRPLPGMAFHRVHGTAWPAIPMWPHLDPTERVLHRPSTAATLNLAAAAAQGSRVFRDADPAYADHLLAAAQTAYRAAHEQPVLLAPDDHGAFGGGPYDDDDVSDDFYWAAAELYLTTTEERYLTDLAGSVHHYGEVFYPDGFDWDNVAAPARLDLATVSSALPDRERARHSVLAAADQLIELQDWQPWGQPYAPVDGWDWGSSGRILNNLIVLATAHELSRDRRYLDAVLIGMDHLLGRNALGQSYITGYGTDHSRHQRTRHFARDLDQAFPPLPPGALAGGPNSRVYPGFPSDSRLAGLPPQLCYLDEPTSEVTNDVCIRWNSALVWITAYLASGWFSASV